MKKIDNTLLLYILMGCAFFGLVAAGLTMIWQSNVIYDQSYRMTEKLIANKSTPVTPPSYSIVKDGYGQSLLYFTLALGVLIIALLLPRIQNVTISPTGGISLLLNNVTQLKEEVENLQLQANSLQETSVGEGGRTKASITVRNAELERMGPGINDQSIYDLDPNKGMWGGVKRKNDREITATVKQALVQGYFEVELFVKSTDSNNPLKGLVKFHLHPTFKNPDPVIAVQNGEAILRLNKVYGAFTVGVEADDGKTNLEIDLAELDGAPELFRSR